MTPQQRQFLERARVARLATADAAGVPHLVPVCFALALDGTRLYITVDEKPKQRDPHRLKRVRNILANPAVAVLVDHYEEDWSRLAWVMVRGRAEVLEAGGGTAEAATERAPEHAAAQALLRARYPQYAGMRLEPLPVIAVAIERTTAWGRLED